jgi:hypothetical protein
MSPFRDYCPLQLTLSIASQSCVFHNKKRGKISICGDGETVNDTVLRQIEKETDGRV